MEILGECWLLAVVAEAVGQRAAIVDDYSTDDPEAALVSNPIFIYWPHAPSFRSWVR
jgi:hypothetical protein